MKIVIVSDVLCNEGNGTNVATMNLVRYLMDHNYDVRVLCPYSDKEDDDRFYIVPTLDLKIFNGILDRVGVKLSHADDNVINECLDGADYIHAIVPFHLCNTVIRLANKYNIPVSIGFHMQAENLTSYFGLKNFGLVNHWVYKYIYRNTFSKVDAIHYPTKFIRDIFEKNIHCHTNGYVISNGVNPDMRPRIVEKPQQFADKIVISSVGRLSKEKSQDTLIKAVLNSKHEKEIQLVLAGQGLQEGKFRRLAKKLTNPIVMQQFTREEVVNIMHYSDIYVHPAIVELEGIACIEALACQKLTIVSDSKKSATRLFVRDKKCIFKKRNYKSLSKLIDYFIDHPEEKERIEKLYDGFADEYSIEHCMSRMEQMILETKKHKDEN